jgi:hypothetical protein
MKIPKNYLTKSSRRFSFLILAIALSGMMTQTLTPAALEWPRLGNPEEHEQEQYADPDRVGLESTEISAEIADIFRYRPDLVSIEALKESNARFFSLDQTRTLKDTQVSVSLSPMNDHSESHLVANPNNPLHMVGGSKFFTEPSNYVFKDGTYTTFDGGKTWLQQVIPGYDKWTITSDPVAAIDDQGNVHYAVLTANKTVNGCRSNFQGSGMYVSTSRDGGIIWENPVEVHLTKDGGLGDDKQWIAADWHAKSPYRGNVYIVWDLFTDEGSGVAFARSTDRGKSFEPYKFIGGLDDSFLGPQIDISPSGEIYVVWANFSDGTIDWTKSTDGGITFTKPAPAARMIAMPGTLPNGTWRNVTLPTFAVSRATGTLFIAWADFRNGDTDIYYARSTDGGQSWNSGSVPTNGRINDDPLKDGMDQFQPALAVSRTGEVGIAWFDRRLTRNTQIDVFQAISTDDGNTFQPNTRVTTFSFDGNVNPAYPKVGSCTTTFIGDYFGMAAGAEGFYPFWTDTRTGVQEIFSVNPFGVSQVEELVYTNAQPVRDLAFDSRGVLYFSETGTQGTGRIFQLTKLDTVPAKTLSQNVDLSQSGGVWAGHFAFDLSGNLFVANGALPGAVFVHQNGNFVSAFTSANSPIYGFQFKDSQLYFATGASSIFSVTLASDGSQPVPTLIYSNPSRTLIGDIALLPTGELYFNDGAEPTGSVYQMAESQETKFFTRLKGPITAMTLAPDGQIWYASENKIFRLSPAPKKLSRR